MQSSKQNFLSLSYLENVLETLPVELLLEKLAGYLKFFVSEKVCFQTQKLKSLNKNIISDRSKTIYSSHVFFFHDQFISPSLINLWIWILIKACSIL